MEAFQKIVLFGAIIILVLALIFIGIALSYSSNKQWPPMTPECPDYWQIDGYNENTTCTNIKDLGTCPPQSGEKHLVMNFNQDIFQGDSGLCNKYNWAKKCGVTWDAVTYGISNPCQTAA